MRPVMAKAIGYMKPDIDPNTRLYVPFNEGVGDVAKDYSQYGNHAQLTDVEWSPDGFNGAGKFNGSSSVGDCGNDTSLNITDAITIEAWVKSVSITTYHTVASKPSTQGVGYSAYLVRFQTTNTLLFRVGDASAYKDISTAITSNEGIHAVFTYDKSYLRGYINGEAITPVAESLTMVPDTADAFLIGGKEVSGVEMHRFNGTMDNVIISSTARSAAQTAADCYEVVCS